MCDWSGEPIEITPGIPKDVENMRKGILRMLMGGLNRGATPYSGPIAPQTNPMMLGAANLLNQMMGYGQYKQPGFMTNPYSNMNSGLGIDWRPDPENIKPKDNQDYTEPDPNKIEKKRLKKK